MHVFRIGQFLPKKVASIEPAKTPTARPQVSSVDRGGRGAGVVVEAAVVVVAGVVVVPEVVVVGACG